MILKDKVAIVTGAAQGVGRGEALALAKEGASVLVVDVNETAAIETVGLISAAGGKGMHAVCDVRVRAEVDRAVSIAIEAFGGVDILVNNAQIIPAPAPFETWTEETMRGAYESGVLGTFHFMQACFPSMKQRGGGRIINTASASGHGVCVPGFSGYGAAKEAVRALTRSVAREWAEHNININAISPSALSPLARSIYKTDEQQRELLKMGGAAIMRWSDPEEDVGRVVVFLSGPDSKQITGCTLGVDGGMAML